jgi:acetylornithine deacetylase/succinyl-diaminopimelate desuccinylase-like protein
MRPLLGATLLVASVCTAAAGQVDPDGPRVRRALAYLERTEPSTIEEQIAICQIEAPPFKEQRRGEDYVRRMREAGIEDVRRDSVGNVIGVIRGTSPDATAVILSGHLDTVFPEGTDVTVRREGTVLHGPGIEDDCRGLAVVLAAARAIRDAGIRPRRTIYFVATVGEEGAGNLRGVRHLFAGELRTRTAYFLSVDDDEFDIIREAVGSNRYRVSYLGPGGHSFSDFGTPNPAHALGRAIARIADFPAPSTPPVTFNVGIVTGGTSVNAIPERASMDVDMRSADPVALAALDARFQQVIRTALAEENARWSSPVRLRLQLDTIGFRPGGFQPETAPIVQAGLRAARRLSVPAKTTAASGDANLPLSLGIPAVAIGSGGVGRGAHSLEEQWDSRDSHLGTQWVLLYLLSLAEGR